jgi:non-heme chloroperoxidase
LERRDREPGSRSVADYLGREDNLVPWAIANASFEREKRNAGVTEIVEIPNRGHSPTIDSGWREVADKALAFIRRFV